MSVPGEQLQTQSRGVQQPLRWPLVASLEQRLNQALTPTQGRLDAKLYNCFVERNPRTREYEVYKRFGLGPPLTTAYAQIGRGTFRGASRQTILAVHGDNLYFNDTQFAGSIAIPVGNAGLQSPMSFTALSLPVGTPNNTVFMQDGLNAYIYDEGAHTVSIVTDINYPAQVVPGAVCIDTTTYVMDIFGNIRGSAIGDPTTWPAINTILAGVTPDYAIALSRQLNYVIAFKQTGTQVFFDNGNSPGSLLQSVPDVFIPYGCAAGWSVKSIDDILFWIAANEKYSPQVIQLSSLNSTIVSTPEVERVLNNINFTKYVPGGGYNIAGIDIYSWTFKHAGHRFYGITSIAQNVTMVYDVDQKEWYIWTSPTGTFWSLISFVDVPPRQSYAVGNVPVPPAHYAQDLSSGQLFPLDTCYVYPTDNGQVVAVDIYTPNMDFGTMRSKTVHALYFNTDRQGAFLKSRYSDDDYNSWSNWRTTNLQAPKPQLSDEGTFPWRRAYHFQHYGPQPFRASSCDLQLDIGTL